MDSFSVLFRFLIKESGHPEGQFLADREFHFVSEDIRIGNVRYLIESLVLPTNLDRYAAIDDEVTSALPILDGMPFRKLVHEKALADRADILPGSESV